MRILPIILIPLIPGFFAFSCLWVVDGGGELFTCVPRFLAGLIAGTTDMNVSLWKRVLIPVYLLIFIVPVVAYAVRPKPGWLRALAALGALHLVFVAAIVLQDD